MDWLIVRNPGSAGGAMVLDEKLSTFHRGVMEQRENAYRPRDTMSLGDAQKIPDASSAAFYSANIKSSERPRSDTNLSLSNHSSVSDDNVEYRENSAFFSGAHSKSRLNTFATSVVRIQHDATIAGTRAGAGDGGDVSRPRSPNASPPSHSSRSLSSDMPPSDTETHLPDQAALVDNMRNHWTTLRERRVTVLNMLEEIRLKRLELQDVHHQRDKTDEALFRAIRAKLFETNPAAMERHLQEADKVRHLDHHAEKKLEVLMDDLRDAEIELDILERQFYSQLARDESPLTRIYDNDDEGEDSRPPSRTSLRGITRDRPENFHPLYEEMREAFRDLQLAKEYLHNLTFKRFAMQSTESPLGPDASEFLRNFDETETNAKSEIDRWTTRFDDLQRQCRERRVIPASTPFVGDSNGYYPVLIEDMSLEDDPPSPGDLAHPLYPILLANPKHVLGDPEPLTPKGALKKAISLPKSTPTRGKLIATAREEYGIDTLVFDAREGDKNDYINRWLLHKLRTSAMEVEVLYATFQTVLRVINVSRWQRDVLVFWSRDQAVQDDTTSADGLDSSAVNPFIDLDSYAVSERRFFPRHAHPQTRTLSESTKLHQIRSGDELARTASMDKIHDQQRR